MMTTTPPQIWFIVNVEAFIVKDSKYLMIIRSEQESHAPGTLTVPGGKVEDAGILPNVLETTLHREIKEEVDIEVFNDFVYLESNAFTGSGGEAVVDIVFLCRYKSGTPRAVSAGEVAEVQWLTAQQVLDHPKAPPWTRQSIQLAETKRRLKQW